jgi:hypothetical protein
MRLTKKTKCGYENEYCEITECSDKLGQLEDILEKYGILDVNELESRLEENVRDFTYLGYGERKVKDYYDVEQELGIDLITFYKNYKELLSIKGRNLRITIEEMEKELTRKELL